VTDIHVINTTVISYIFSGALLKEREKERSGSNKRHKSIKMSENALERNSRAGAATVNVKATTDKAPRRN
jgi:hypothetical protein